MTRPTRSDTGTAAAAAVINGLVHITIRLVLVAERWNALAIP